MSLNRFDAFFVSLCMKSRKETGAKIVEEFLNKVSNLPYNRIESYLTNGEIKMFVDVNPNDWETQKMLIVAAAELKRNVNTKRHFKRQIQVTPNAQSNHSQ